MIKYKGSSDRESGHADSHPVTQNMAYGEGTGEMKVLIASDCYKYQTSGAANVVIMLAEEL